jgi:CheY-like chemotaxis protein
MEPFSALLLSNDSAALAITQKVLEEYGVTVKTAGSASAAEHLLKTAKFDLGVFDYELPDVLNLAVARSTYANPKMVFALLPTGHMKDLHGKRVHFVVQKPFTADLFARSLRAAYGTMVRERRLAFRHPVEIVPVTSLLLVEKGNQCLHSANILDLSQTGMCIQTMEILPQGAALQIDFHLPETRDAVHVTGIVMWTRASGRTGVKFAHVPPEELKLLISWLNSRLPYDVQNVPRAAPTASRRERFAEASV